MIDDENFSDWVQRQLSAAKSRYESKPTKRNWDAVMLMAGVEAEYARRRERPTFERTRDFRLLASAMRKCLPAPILAAVCAHLDPTEAFVTFLRQRDGAE